MHFIIYNFMLLAIKNLQFNLDKFDNGLF